MSGEKPDEHARDPLTRIYDDKDWAGWWHYPAALTGLGIATGAVFVAAVLI